MPEAKLTIECVLKSDPKSPAPRTLFKDAVVTVKAVCEGTGVESSRDTVDGIAAFGEIPAGKYKLRPDSSKIDTCKFDFAGDARDIELLPGDDKTVLFEVEPLYQTVQFIAHCLLTIPDKIYIAHVDDKFVENKTTDGSTIREFIGGHKGTWKGKYHGLLDDAKDIDARVALIADTLERAHGRADNNPANLKVFMVPECFFQGTYGAYLFEQMGYLIGRLQDLVKDPKWKDWMFVFGTVNCITEIGGIREMMNFSPVLRGGLGASGGGGGGETDPRTRLIQKAKNSAELLDRSELIPYEGYLEGISRKPAVNEDVQFHATENEEKVGQILQRLLNEADIGALFKNHGLEPGHWADLKKELEENLKTLGMARVVRAIRCCSTAGKAAKLDAWAYSGFEDASRAHLEPETYLATWQQLAYSFLKKKWHEHHATLPPKEVREFNQTTWQFIGDNDRGKIRRNTILKAVADDLSKEPSTLFETAGVRLPYQKAKLRSEIERLRSDDALAIAFFDKSLDLPPAAGISIFPVCKKLLELYVDEKAIADVSLKLLTTNFNYRDYCFAGARKAGPWLTWVEADQLKPCKKLIFGVEICADHANGRLRNSLTAKGSGPMPVVDVQLIPSCGMYPNHTNIVARGGGYAFNCDGWTASGIDPDPLKGKGQFIEVLFDGPRSEKVNANPVRPHSVVAKGGGPTFPMETEAFKPLVVEVSAALSKGIFGQGPGELHVYSPQNLPS